MRTQDFLKLGTGCFLVALAAVSLSTESHAQAIPTQLEPSQGVVDPGRLEERFDEGLDIPDLGEGAEIQRAIIQNAPPNAENITFVLRNLSIDGVSAYEGSDISSIYESKLGTTVSLADIYAIANRLTNKYRNEGYILTQVVVPPQTIDGGNVKLRVVEGFVDRVVVEGNDDPQALDLIREYAGRITTGGALNLKRLEKYLLLINDLPGVSARSVLSPSRSQAGASDLRIIVERDPFDGILGIDNYGSRYLGPVQLTAGGSANSFFGLNEQITAQIVSAPFGNNDPELTFGSVSYEQPINSRGTTARAFYSHSATEPGFDIDIFNVRGHSTSFGAAVEHAVIRSRSSNLSIRGQVDFRDVRSRSDIDVSREDNIRALRVGGRYDFLDTILGVGVNSVDVELSQGLNIFGASEEGDINMTRPAGEPQFRKFNIAAQRLQRVTNDVNLLVGFEGQVSNNALLSSEEFGVGGANVGRGYDPSEIVGDDGYSTTVELQWRQPLESAFSAVEDYSVYGFWDFGKVWNDDATISDDDESLASAGVGVRANLVNNFEGGAFVAFPLTRDVQTYDDQDPRYYFNLSRRF